jgi:hypothetical protein
MSEDFWIKFTKIVLWIMMISLAIVAVCIVVFLVGYIAAL